MFKNTEQNAYFGSAVAGFFAQLSWGDIGAIFGILFGLLTVLTNWYFKRKEDKRAEKALELMRDKYNNEKS
ncbi:phage holin family protein [Pasteurella multocida]|uniref:phage holin n=1 Tax=Pasteurella multocida TaxID=747 RepID=UPI0020215110|nr:phage holin [Pasteurella multocida]MCL7761420.1 phage holin family protein [Pasteurella multocida]MCL7783043.1 phage holin family protein [Pasteurella multocida]